ncbi:MAG: hypothetical protein C0506_02270 [Anaerolinea sp.]|nr:hypothetical protein [Anaerolinea sp.]
MSEVEFARPWLLAALPLIPPVFVLWAWGMARGRARARLVSRHAIPRPPYLAAVLLSAAAALAVVAAALPQWGTKQSYVPRTGADLIVILDVSRSMDATDAAPTRLEASKVALAQTLARLGGDRVGLVIFAGTARLRFPLTTDLVAATQVISSVATGAIIVEGGTNASLGLDVAIAAFADENPGGRAVLLITDGDDLGGDPASAARRVKDAGIDLLVAGVGTSAGAPVPVVDPRTGKAADKLDAFGQPIITKLNEPFLRALAVAAGGRYIGSDPTLIAGAVAGRLQALKSTRIEQRPTTIPVERYQWFAGAALAALVLGSVAEWLGRRSGRLFLLGAALLPVILLAGCETAAHTANEEGRRALKAGDATLAIEKFTEAQAAKPDDPNLSLNLAAAFHAAGRYDEASLVARRVTGSAASDDRARAFASLGHHEFAAGRLPESLEAFHRSLLEDPDNSAARHDYEVVWRLLNPERPEPPADPTPGPGTPTPAPGADGGSPSPGAGGGGTPSASGTPVPAPGTPAPGASPGAGPPGPTTTQDIDRQLRQLDAQIARLVEQAGDTPTASQAIEILRLLAERSRLAGLRDENASADPRDY